MSFRTRNTLRRAAIGALFLSPLMNLPASAQQIELLASGPVDLALAAQNTDVSVGFGIADKIQQQFASGAFNKAYADQRGAGVLTSVRAAYAQSLFKPIWTKNTASSMLSLPDLLTENGIPVTAEEREALAAMVKSRRSGSAAEKAQADIALTMAWVGMKAQMEPDFLTSGEGAVASTDAPVMSALTVDMERAGAGQAYSLIAGLEPSQPQYQELKSAYQHYNAIVDAGGWEAIPNGDAIEVGDKDARVPALRQRLLIEGYFSLGDMVDVFNKAMEDIGDKATTDEDRQASVKAYMDAWAVTYDEDLQAAIETFQTHHGLAPDGVIGGRTLEALNESAASKLHRIQVSMEKWRGMNEIDGRYVWANIPSFTAEGWDNNVREISMKSIVGKPSRQTPVFSDEIEYTVTNPKWYAPINIVRADKLPKLQKDPGYAARNGYTIFDRSTGETVSATTVDWTDPASAREFQFVQKPGANNALGELKIIFPNEHSVYLHGTPSKSLFNRTERAFSSGCVRLEHPVEMAKWIAEGDKAVTPEEIEQKVDAGIHQRLDFAKTTPVHLTYITVTVGDDGLPMFWRDIYNEEEGGVQMETRIAALYEPASQKSDTISDFASLERQPQRAG